MLVAAGGQQLALPMAALREVVPARPWTRLPGAPACVRGVVNLRGRMVTVVDLGAALELGAPSTHAGQRVVVVHFGGREVGLSVDEVLRIVAEPATEGGEPAAERGHQRFRTVDPAALLGPIFDVTDGRAHER